MTNEMKALVSTIKVFGSGLAVGIGYYFLLDIIGVKVGMALMIVAFIGAAFWIAYRAKLDELTWQEKFDKSL